LAAAADYVIAASNAAGSTLDTLSIAVIAPPANLAYAVNPAQYTERVAITPNTPTVTGVVARFAVTPALPAGLSLDTVTGTISGTPTAAAPAGTYVVAASNVAGSATDTLNLVVLLVAPENLAYPTNPAHYPAGTDIAPNIPTVLGTVSSYAIAPTLPAGLVLDAASGMIWGRPSGNSPPTDYTVTATNAAGSDTVVLRISTGSAVAIADAGTRGLILRLPGAAAWKLPLPEKGTARIEIADISGRIHLRKAYAFRERLEWTWESAHAAASKAKGIFVIQVTIVDSNGNLLARHRRKWTPSP
jgi:hypothetical protein